MITTGLRICQRIESLLNSVTARIAAGGTASAVSCSEHFSRPRMETALNSQQHTFPAGMTRDEKRKLMSEVA